MSPLTAAIILTSAFVLLGVLAKFVVKGSRSREDLCLGIELSLAAGANLADRLADPVGGISASAVIAIVISIVLLLWTAHQEQLCRAQEQSPRFLVALETEALAAEAVERAKIEFLKDPTQLAQKARDAAIQVATDRQRAVQPEIAAVRWTRTWKLLVLCNLMGIALLVYSVAARVKVAPSESPSTPPPTQQARPTAR